MTGPTLRALHRICLAFRCCSWAASGVEADAMRRRWIKPDTICMRAAGRGGQRGGEGGRGGGHEAQMNETEDHLFAGGRGQGGGEGAMRYNSDGEFIQETELKPPHTRTCSAHLSCCPSSSGWPASGCSPPMASMARLTDSGPSWKWKQVRDKQGVRGVSQTGIKGTTCRASVLALREAQPLLMGDELGTRLVEAPVNAHGGTPQI